MYINLYDNHFHTAKEKIHHLWPFFLTHFIFFIVIQVLAVKLFLSLLFLVNPNGQTVQAKVISPLPDQGIVLSAQTDKSDTLIATDPALTELIPTDIPLLTMIPITPEPTAKTINYYSPLPKDHYKIVIIGDSMVDTMGEVHEYLDHVLTSRYPGVEFKLFNFGKGSETVSMGLARFYSPLKYQDRDFPSIPDIKPDIIVVGSFAYNPYSPPDKNMHWVELTKLVQTARSITPNVFLLAEIAPLRSDFGKGPMGVNYETSTAYTHSQAIIDQLEGTVGLAKELNVPLIDAYHPSIANSETKEGKRIYVNPSDGIHPSVSGHEFMAKLIADGIF